MMDSPRGRPDREEVRVFQSALDKRTVTTTVFAQPAFYMGLVSALAMVFTQRFPEEFMPRKYLTMSYNGIRAPSLLTIPFCVISGIYFSVASVITTAPSPLVGHLFGYGVSLGVGLTMLSLRRISWYYPLFGLMYLSFGGLHHYRKMMVYGDNAPIFYWSDFGEISRDMRARRREKRQHLQQKESLAKGRAIE
ncbi:putative mitochondrial hypothetical protein [Leptomonas pyrrhocoris]|uniref:Transmembrane protein n=1 Tax=Leptomonas pyrrhocoris TaxID=157538 RepID=A0A0M9FXQ5_LEPPY|nr:putative mitochondrial hypothetical protein [Leptomonas pyrrhocoris]XP_015656553.1 putative mitochondrial hypothetical protein [Leptomonas pyrrhocoris]KPA78113.1 putative mitochondrial hypothetical protein [Leptomonas pyrrhocoris]KPA78114.1 putative mitochondrial hypothetical protein [Leptomonas pyrrhocoris]|eukprot:XP_015656552.1 putative mitochondrial hypothetical protein [Leptomonas pyrrhocoris]